MIRVAMVGVYVDDVARARAFYTDVLGFETRAHVDMGGGAPFITVGPVGAQQDVELLLEPGEGPIAEPYHKAMREVGHPCVVLGVDDVRAEYERLTGLGVTFVQGPQQLGSVITAVLDDSVGNLVQLMQSRPAK